MDGLPHAMRAKDAVAPEPSPSMRPPYVAAQGLNLCRSRTGSSNATGVQARPVCPAKRLDKGVTGTRKAPKRELFRPVARGCTGQGGQVRARGPLNAVGCRPTLRAYQPSRQPDRFNNFPSSRGRRAPWEHAGNPLLPSGPNVGEPCQKAGGGQHGGRPAYLGIASVSASAGASRGSCDGLGPIAGSGPIALRRRAAWILSALTERM
jgi:hypothetical protein